MDSTSDAALQWATAINAHIEIVNQFLGDTPLGPVWPALQPATDGVMLTPIQLGKLAEALTAKEI